MNSRKVHEHKRMASYTPHKRDIYMQYKAATKKCRKDSRTRMAQKKGMSKSQLSAFYKGMDVHHKKPMTFTIVGNNILKLNCPLDHIQLVPQRINRGTLRDAEILDPKRGFDVQYQRAMSQLAPPKVATSARKTTQSVTKKGIDRKTLQRALAVLKHETNSKQFRALQTNALLAARASGTYSLLTKAQVNRWVNPCIHRKRPSSGIVVTTYIGNRMHVLAGMKGRHTFPTRRLHIPTPSKV